MNQRQDLINNPQIVQKNQKNVAFQQQKQKQLKIVSEYLQLNLGKTQKQELLPDFQHQKCQFIQKRNLKDQVPLMQEGDSQPQKSKTSLYHNFQKHLSTTLKTKIKLKKTVGHQKSQSMLAGELWEYFRLSQKSSKKFIYCLLGGDIINNSLQKKQKYCQDYKQILAYFSEYKQEQINAAQKYLCRQIIRQSKFLIQENNFSNRKITKTEQFKLYYMKFIKQLQSGKISRRLPKKSQADQSENKQQKHQDLIQ